MKYSKYEFLKEACFESGEINRENFETMYLEFPWIEMLKKQNEVDEKDVKYSPGIRIENDEGKAVDVSIVGKIDDYEFYICYKRPTLIKKRKWFKMVEYLKENYNSIIPQQTLENGLEASLCLFDKDFETLEKKYG